MKRTSRRLLATMAIVLLLAGCDTTGPGGDTVVLTANFEAAGGGNPMRFTFKASAVQPGTPVTLRCSCTIDLAGFLEQQGFELADIVGGTLKSARVVLLFPISEQLDFIDDAVLSLEASGVSAIDVATRSTFTAQRDASLDVIQGRALGTVLSRSSLAPVLTLTVADVQPGATYELAVALSIQVEVAGV